MTATQVNATGLTARLENVQHNLYMDNLFNLQYYLTIRIVKKNAVGLLEQK
jgi:hypothetical protein